MLPSTRISWWASRLAWPQLSTPLARQNNCSCSPEDSNTYFVFQGTPSDVVVSSALLFLLITSKRRGRMFTPVSGPGLEQLLPGAWVVILDVDFPRKRLQFRERTVSSRLSEMAYFAGHLCVTLDQDQTG